MFWTFSIRSLFCHPFTCRYRVTSFLCSLSLAFIPVDNYITFLLLINKINAFKRQFCSHHIHNWDRRQKTGFQLLIMSDGPVISRETCNQSGYITYLSVVLSCPHLLGETALSDRTRETAAVSAAITLRYTKHR